MRQFPKILVLVLLISLIGSTLLFLHSTSDYQNVGTLLHSQTNVLSHELQDEPTAKIEEGYIVHTSHCQIPDVDLWHPSILQYVRNNSPSLACSRIATKPPLTYTEDEMLYINKTNSPFYNGSLLFCEYVEIFRPPNNDFKFDLGHKRVVFTENVLVKKEFIKVYCYSTNNTLMYQNLHAFTPTKPLLRHMKDNLSLRHKRRGYLEQLNVLMVGLDSVSRLNFHRQFPKTLKILRSNLKAYEMYGYNKVRDNTFINLTPMFLGKYVEETDWNETNNEPFDKYKFAWKRFADAGYHTLFAEDAPSIAIWNFEKEGFHHPPADYYLRPFSLAMASTSSMWTNYKHCFGGRLETDITLEYVYNFIKSRQRAPHFAFTFLTRPTYDSVNQNTDQSHAQFLESMIRCEFCTNIIKLSLDCWRTQSSFTSVITVLDGETSYPLTSANLKKDFLPCLYLSLIGSLESILRLHKT
ncbi:hypothetical protein EB796_004468 [Bugula neritina]|uniref:Uncharacterized protein n=1 Tax=Bugula neritina TaxID=10212 RepID=A0A7J7KH55_BUGNE|nr:hypothetical protein EB796_004468 [Bugula neritina]